MFFVLASFLDAQEESFLTRRIVWSGGEHALHFAVEIQRNINGNFQNHLREITTSLFLEVLLPPGDYRFRIIPYDILGRPAEGTDWFPFEIRPPVRQELAVTGIEQVQVISVEDYNEQFTNEQSNLQFEPNEIEETLQQENSNRFNTIGLSVGTSFIDPVIIVTIHGTLAVYQNLFIELGCDFGFLSVYEDVESYYSIYPFVTAGFYMPFNERNGFFIGAGAGYMFGNYIFSYGDTDISVFGINLTAGFNLGNLFTFSYTLRTNFHYTGSKITTGFIQRF